MPVPIQDLDFQYHMSWFFFFIFNDLKLEVIVCFVEIGGIVDHYYLMAMKLEFVASLQSMQQALRRKSKDKLAQNQDNIHVLIDLFR